MFSPELEICAETPQACQAAQCGGAHRIEICAALDEGGLTPSHGLIQAAIQAAEGLPVHVLLRPRAGDFVYSEAEFEVIRRDLLHASDLGVAGFVVGILTHSGAVDCARIADLVSLAGAKPVTFHRAFDHSRDLPGALEQIIEAGCKRLLTSGGQPTVQEGQEAIVRLADQAGNRIRIAAGGGLTPALAAHLRRFANVDLHASLRYKSAAIPAASRDPLWDGDHRQREISSADVEDMAATLSVIPRDHR